MLAHKEKGACTKCKNKVMSQGLQDSKARISCRHGRREKIVILSVACEGLRVELRDVGLRDGRPGVNCGGGKSKLCIPAEFQHGDNSPVGAGKKRW